MIPQLQREAPVSLPVETKRWSLATRIGFRFVFAYFILYVLPGPVGALSSYKPSSVLENNGANWVWHRIVPWVGTSLFHLKAADLAEAPNGSGDELYDYVLIPCLLVTALLVTAIWSWLDRKRPNYEVLHEWLRLLMRMTVGWGMLGYGIKKLIGAQFTPPTLARQLQPFGQATPMGMLWTFMGSSQPYSFFGGFGETLGGVLLVLPGLTALGSLVSLVMMTNVLMLNLCYDVPRKIFSLHLVLMCLFLLIPDLRRLINVFILNRRAEPVHRVSLLQDKLLDRVALLLPMVFGGFVLFVAGRQSVIDLKQLVTTLPAPVYGVWTVDELVIDGVVHPPLLTDAERWQRVIFDAPKILSIDWANGNHTRYYMQLDLAKKSFDLWDVDHPKWNARLALDNPDADRMTLEGRFGSQQISARLVRADLSDPQKYPLMNQGFHWVNPNVNNPVP
ncbi:MAG TPA: hypothetical protein VL240_03165 [Candidatus Binatia bacterium]|nr:hypothetical protein [Candidatus Binatia bacterium]